MSTRTGGTSTRKASPTGTAGDGVRSSLEVDALRKIVELLEASEVTHLEWSNGDEKLVIQRGSVTTAAPVVMSSSPAVVTHATVAEVAKPRASAPPRPVAPEPDKKGHIITSPFVGTFYRNPAPDQPPFVQVGAPVKKGQVLCIVEAMKLMNEIESEVAGKVAELFVQDAQPVEFGQPLFRIEPA
ncbi:MAG: acetyl-CoA carboxylase biotin carboxyl carrier protein [Archangium sp.]|nr:acetyl-CoA carboxylase biotin carboxyl carrier protein [Archangium sp.]